MEWRGTEWSGVKWREVEGSGGEWSEVEWSGEEQHVTRGKIARN